MAKAKTEPTAGSRQLAALAEKMRGKYGEPRIANRVPPVVVSTGSVAIDRALRIGGVQVGQVYEVIGKKDSGKSSLGISIMIQHRLRFTERGVAYVNMENTFDPDRATAMGLDCSEAAQFAGTWFPMLPESSEMASDMARDMASSGLVSCVVVDSVGSMESARVLKMDAAKAADSVGKNARIITQMTKALSTEARLNSCTIILVNQPRANIGGFGGDISAGPKAMEHSTTVKLQMSALGGEEDVRKLKLPGEDEPLIVSHKVVVRVPRMKNGLGGRVAETFLNKVFTDEYGPPGFDEPDAYLSAGLREGVVSLGGSYYTFPDGHRENGRVSAVRHLRHSPGTCEAIRASIPFDVPTDALTGEAITDAQ